MSFRVDKWDERYCLFAPATARLREEVKPYLNAEIVSRYYYQRGTCQQQLKRDKVYDRAAALLADHAEYDKILRP